ncbi:tether containing UBX domain for GLUT4 [Bactrocera neohumeralis]|uniref:tether containing UBX domain for GLUT4 n=1 Tax=Bactrocera tryoni TaxID=59916 RepID=UPI001A99EE7E|nr:tether containing UBX domain for GLUT4 [Bactrocera tryoni]XP_050331305.1 tether containing UBX domain for GLUT4 [Bactrocera neohumeralis]
MEGKVTVLTPNFRRQNVKVTPNTTILQILEEVCLKHGLDSHEYCLKHHNKEVGLTQMFRFSGLPNNCLLEMSQTERRRTESVVNICIQLEDGSRVQGEFKPSNSLWQVIEELDSEVLKTYSSPVAIYMRQEIIGKERMTETTLKSLGIIEGRAMVRVINKTAEDLKSQANVYVPPTVKEKPKEDEEKGILTQKNSIKNSDSGSGGFKITKDLVQSLKKSTSNANTENDAALVNTTSTAATKESEPEKPKYDWGSGVGYSIQSSRHEQDSAKDLNNLNEDDAGEMDIEPEVNIIGERNAVLYSLDETQTQAEELPDSFFDLTVEDLKLVLRDLKKASRGDEDAPLLTERLRQLEGQKTMLNKIAQYKNCVIRIQFPDRLVLQGIFKPIDKVSDVMDFVRKFLHDDQADFHLFTIPPKYILPMDKTLLELDFVPTAVVHFVFQDKEENATAADATVEPKYLRLELKEKLTTVEGAFYAANKLRSTVARGSKPNSNDAVNDASLQAQSERRNPDTSLGAIPKKQRNDNINNII